MSNLIKAFVNIASNNNYELEIKKVTNGSNRANNMGEGLEMFVKNAFSGNFAVTDAKQWYRNFWDTFSFKGAKGKIPDMVLKNSDAIEVKKTEVLGSLQLNSSHPKAKLYSNQNITEECRDCEEEPWVEKDIIYTMGHIPQKSKKLKSLWFVYGTCYAAKKEVYQEVVREVKSSLEASENIEINTDGKELGKVEGLDALNITYLRIRGMWVIKHPSKVYEYLYKQEDELFSMVAIIPLEKYNLFPLEDRSAVESIKNIEIKTVDIPDPNNEAAPITIKLLIFKVVS